MPFSVPVRATDTSAPCVDETRKYRHILLTCRWHVSLIFELPYCRIGSLTEAGIAKRQTASQYLKQLVEIGVLAEVAVTKEKLFIHPKLMQLLTQDSNQFALYANAAQ